MSFGTTLRAIRLGYFLSRKRNAWIKLADYKDGSPRVRVMVAPRGHLVPNDKFKEYRAWGDKSNPNRERLIDLIPTLKYVKNVKCFLAFDVDAETGERI